MKIGLDLHTEMAPRSRFLLILYAIQTPIGAAGKPLNPNNVKLPQLSNGYWSKIAQRVAGQSVISSSLNTTINGGSFKDNLTNALLANIGSQVQAERANLIADNGQVLDKNS